MELKRKEVQVIMLPTENDSCIVKGNKTQELMYFSIVRENKKNNYGQNQHLYFTSDEEIKEGDRWLYHRERNSIGELTKWESFDNSNNTWYKIIATTNTKLTIPTITNVRDKPRSPMSTHSADFFVPWDRPLPTPSKAFIEKYCKLGGINKVMVEYEHTYEVLERDHGRNNPLKLKTNFHNEITIHSIKNSWNKEEVSIIILKYITDMNPDIKVKQELNFEWIEKNL